MSDHITLKDQWRLARAAACDRRLSRGDVAVLMIVIDRYFKAKGNSWASLDLLAGKAGINRRNTIRSLKRLKSLDYLGVLSRGRRGRATEYLPNFKSVQLEQHFGVADDTLTAKKYGVADDTLIVKWGVAHDTLTDKYGVVCDTPTYLHGRPTKPGLLVSRNLEAEEGTRGVASPPPPSAPVGAGAVPPRDPMVGFRELWAAWGCKLEPHKAKAGYFKLNPDDAFHANLMTAATAWTAAYEDANTPKEYRKRLASWLAEDGWLGEPVLYRHHKAASLANRRKPGRKRGATPVVHKPCSRRARPDLLKGLKQGTRRKPRAKPYSKFGAVKPNSKLGLMHRWLCEQVEIGNLTVPLISDLLGIGEKDVRVLMNGRSTLNGGKWRQLQVAARKAAS